MKKVIKINKNIVDTVGKNQLYVYRISGFNLDKISLEKHLVVLNNSFDTDNVAELNEDTKVGIITQKVASELLPILIQFVDNVAISFESNEKMITAVSFLGISSVI